MTTATKEQNAAALAGNNGFSLISNEKLLQLYATMLKCRLLAERAQVLFPQARLDIDAAVLGREAAAVSVAIDLLPEDAVAASPNDLIVHFIKGEPLDKIFARLSAPADAQELAAQLSFAIGAAQIDQTEKNGRLAVAFSSGDSGFSHEALNTAGAQRLPILFVCQAGISGEQAPTGAAETAAQLCGFPCIPVDGSDLVAVYRVATEAIAHARKGNGATLIECSFDRSAAHDPIVKMEAYLTRKGLFSEELKLEVAAGFKKELDAAIALLPSGDAYSCIK
jgi:TPP-dependent pyruvate/acetoin dehydrogenase alpha subunit